MKDSRLIETFAALTKKERAELTKALRSPFFNQREDLIALWDLLCESKETPNKEAAFAKIYPSEKYDIQKIYLLMSWLLGLIERVLVILQNEENKIDNALNRSVLYRKKGLEKHFQSSLSEIKNLQQKAGRQDAEYYREVYQLELEQYELTSINRSADLNLQRLSDTLDIGFMVEKLRQSCFLLAHQAVVQKDYNTGLLSLLLSHIEVQTELLEIPAIRTYYYCYRSLKEPAETAHFEAFSTAILQYHNLFSESDIRDLYLMAVNYCIKKHNSGDENYARQGLDLYKKGLTEGFLLENNILSRFVYRNIVSWGLLFKEFDWTDTFIHDYRNRLERSYRDSMFSFCLARLEYSRRNYEAAMLLLQRAEYRDTLLALAAKTILMKIYYETDEFEALEAHLSSMKTYLVRKRVLGYHKTNYQNIIKYTKKLLENAASNAGRVQNPASVTARNTLREAIENESILTEREWLLAQL
jgi:hypothetical protein